MTHWLLMFRPETYEKVKEHGLIGVNGNHGKRIQLLRPGDKFVAYVSRKRVLDAHGEITSESFVDDAPVFGEGTFYPYRARVRFDGTGAAVDAKELLWGLKEFEEGAKTTPSNLLLCRGGFMAITEGDYRWLREELAGGGALSPT